MDALLAILLWLTVGGVVIWSDRSVRRRDWGRLNGAEAYGKLRGM